jgi:hypothetical protein
VRSPAHREGATENSTACTELLADLVERNLRTDHTILAELDGAKALAPTYGLPDFSPWMN